MKKKKIVFWVVIFFFFGIFFVKEEFMLHNLSVVQKEHEEQLNMIKSQNQQLLNEVKLTKRSDYIENQAREKLGLVKPGEIIFIDRNKKGSN